MPIDTGCPGCAEVGREIADRMAQASGPTGWSATLTEANLYEISAVVHQDYFMPDVFAAVARIIAEHLEGHRERLLEEVAQRIEGAKLPDFAFHKGDVLRVIRDLGQEEE